MSTTTQLDANQVIKKVYDEGTGSLKVVGLDPIVSRLAADTDSVSIGDVTATNFLVPNADGSLNVTDNGASLTVDNAGTFAVQATLAAETTKVIGTVNQGTSPWVVSGTATTSPAVVDTTTWLNAVTAGADITSSNVNILSYRIVGIMFNWASLDQTDANITFQGSLDGVIWDVVGSTNMTSPTDHQFYSLLDEPYKLMQLVYAHGTNSTGTITAKYVLRA